MSESPANSTPSLESTDGELVSVRITIEPRLLEKLLDVLARLEFPINPQLYHDAASHRAAGVGALQAAATVEFPAWAGRLPDVRDALQRAGFLQTCLTVVPMLAEIRASAAAAGAPCKDGTRHGVHASG